MSKPKRVGHLVLNVRDIEVSTRFYTEVLGFEVAVERANMTFLTCGKIHHDLALFKAAEDSPPVSEGQVGLNHFAIQMDDLDALKGAYQRLKENGVSVDNTVDHGMTQSVYFHDPDGIRMEIFCNSTSTAEEGLALMRSPDRQNKELVLEDAPA
jgi:catechol 2,3-dioxygenase